MQWILVRLPLIGVWFQRRLIRAMLQERCPQITREGRERIVAMIR